MTKRARQLLFLSILLLFLTAVGSVLLFQNWRSNNPLAWLSLQDMVGVCQAADSLEAARAARVDPPPANAIDAQAASTAAQEAVARLYPDYDPGVLMLSRPLLVEVSLHADQRTLAYLVFARLKDASPNLESMTEEPPVNERLGAAAILYLDARSGEVVRAITAQNVLDPYLDCMRNMGG